MSAVDCCACKRKFQQAAAVPVPNLQRPMASPWGCPECFDWDERKQLAIRCPGGRYGNIARARKKVLNGK